jgi:hypothetical protein
MVHLEGHGLLMELWTWRLQVGCVALLEKVVCQIFCVSFITIYDHTKKGTKVPMILQEPGGHFRIRSRFVQVGWQGGAEEESLFNCDKLFVSAVRNSLIPRRGAKHILRSSLLSDCCLVTDERQQ